VLLALSASGGSLSDAGGMRSGSCGLQAKVELIASVGVGSAGAGGAIPREDEDRHEQPGSEQRRSPFKRRRVAIEAALTIPTVRAWAVAKLAAALAKIVFSSAVFTEPPTC